MSSVLYKIFLLSLLLFTTVFTCEYTCDYCLSSIDFENGTYRIQSAGKYCLSQDIEFDPRPVSDIFDSPNTPYKYQFPRINDDDDYPGCDTLSGAAFALGWFAVISIEVDNVELDLKNYQISMSKSFYIQQRFFSIIEIGKSSFITGQGPADFGKGNNVSNVYIHDGTIGLSSHSGIHGNDNNNVTIENLRICDFETAGIQLNGFDGIVMNNLIIGPSSTQVKPCGYYSNGRFLTYALYQLLNKMDVDFLTETITFQGNRTLTIQEIYDNLIKSLDIAYRSFFDSNSDDDKNDMLYEESISFFANPSELPDGSALYGIILHSHGVAIGGFGNGQNNEGMGENVEISNIKIQDLRLNANEIPAVYFDDCKSNYSHNDGYKVIKGPFGDVMDLRRMVGGWNNAQIIDLGDDYTGLEYVGNVLSDAQIALGLFGNDSDTLYGTQGQNEEFLKWALNEYNNESYDGLPSCISFICNGDIMFHTNKGVMGLRIDLIENVEIENIVIKRLINKSPLSSYACSNYSGAHDGGNPENEPNEGGMGTDTKGISITGGDVIFDGYNNVIEKLISYNGDVVGLGIKKDAAVIFDYVYSDELPSKEDDSDTEDDRSAIHINKLAPGYEITFALLAELLVDKKYPYPNNFYGCNVLIENKTSGSVLPYPPNGVDKVWCADYIPNNRDDILANLLPVQLDIDAQADDDEVDDDDSDDANDNAISIKGKHKITNLINIIHSDNDDDNHTDIVNKYTNDSYLYFMLGLFCIIMVIFVLVTFIMKFGKIIPNVSGKNKLYKKAKIYYDSQEESDLTEEEQNDDDIDIHDKI